MAVKQFLNLQSELLISNIVNNYGIGEIGEIIIVVQNNLDCNFMFKKKILLQQYLMDVLLAEDQISPTVEQQLTLEVSDCIYFRFCALLQQKEVGVIKIDVAISVTKGNLKKCSGL